MVAWLRLVGWDAQQLGGGYKRWRRHVIDTIERIAPQLRLRVICGATGSAKTRVLQALAARGAQVVDLEQLARHKGSLLGALPGQAQPTQKAFETALASAIERLDLRRDVFIEAESRRIGRVALPTSLVERMRGGECAQIVASVESRLGYLLRDYAYLGDDPQALAGLLEPMICLHGRERVQAWQALAEQGRLAELYAQLIEVHYDPLYERSQSAHYHAWASRRRLLAAGLDEAGIEALAGALLEPPRP